jgi:putative alpha-1,2-mannosidase
VQRASGETITIDANGASADAAYVQSLTVDGTPHSRAWLPESFAVGGGRLQFAVGSKPAPTWGSRPEDEPPSFAPRK